MQAENFRFCSFWEIPRCVIIAGCAEAEFADEAQRCSFERFRERLVGVTLVTFDEIFNRIAGLVDLLEKSQPGVLSNKIG